MSIAKSHILWFSGRDKWHDKEKWTNMRYSLAWTVQWEQSTPMNWIEGLVQNFQKVTNYTNWRGPDATRPKCDDYNNQDEETNPSKTIYNDRVAIKKQK